MSISEDATQIIILQADHGVLEMTLVGRNKRVNLDFLRKFKLSLVERPQMKIAFWFSVKGSDRVEELAVQWSQPSTLAGGGRASGGR